eukprot:780346-Ditylum_brightwellii.AAC.1
MTVTANINTEILPPPLSFTAMGSEAPTQMDVVEPMNESNDYQEEEQEKEEKGTVVTDVAMSMPPKPVVVESLEEKEEENAFSIPSPQHVL